MGAVPNIFLEQSPNRQAMSHITSEERGFVIYDQDLFDSTASSSVVITLYLSWMPSLRYSPRHIAAWCNSHFALFYFPAIPISYPKLKLPPPLPNTHAFSSDELLAEPKTCIYQTISEKSIHSGHRIYIHCIYTTSLSDLTGCAQQWMVSRVLRSTQGVIPTAARWSELSLAQQTGGAEAKRLFLPREQGCRGEKRWTGANGTSLPAFKFQEKMDFYALRSAEEVDTVWRLQSCIYLTSALFRYCI